MANLYNVPLQNGIQLTTSSALLTGVTSSITFTVNVNTLLQASSSIKGILVIDRIDPQGNETPAKTEYISFEGVSTNTVTTLVRGLAGTTDQDHSAGAIVEFVPDVTWAQAINDVFTLQHNADGSHKTSAFASLSSLTLTGTTFSGGSLISTTIATSNIDTFTFNSNNAVFASNISGAVNQVTVINSLTSLAPQISATGTDTNVSLQLTGKGTGKVYPQLQYGYVTSNTNLSTATTGRQDVPGLTLTFTPQVNSVCVATSFLDIEVGSTSATILGSLVNNGSDVSGGVIFQGTLDRGTCGQSWVFNVNAGTSYTIKMQASRPIGAGTGTVYSGNSTLGYFLISQ